MEKIASNPVTSVAVMVFSALRIASRRGVENRGSVISVPLALREFMGGSLKRIRMSEKGVEFKVGSLGHSRRNRHSQNRHASCPKDPSVLKTVRRVNFGTGTKFGTDVAKRYGNSSQKCLFF